MTPFMHARLQGVDDEAQQRDALRAVLAQAVPLWIEEVRAWTPEQRCARAADASGLIASGEKCDALRGRHGSGPSNFANGYPNGDGVIFNALAMGLALLSCHPGGITYLGTHWETAP
jgi:hypothetical protein